MTDCLMLSVVVQLRWLLLANASQNAESTPSQTPATWPAINLAAMVARKTCSRFTYTGRIEGWVDEYAGYLASYMSSGSLGIGTPSCPWYVRARRGQRINLTLFNFISPTIATPGVLASKLVDRCYHVGVVRDRSNREMILTWVVLMQCWLVTDGRTDGHN